MGIGRNLFRILYKRDDIQVTATATLAWFPGTYDNEWAIPTAASLLSSASDSSAEAIHSSSR